MSLIIAWARNEEELIFCSDSRVTGGIYDWDAVTKIFPLLQREDCAITWAGDYGLANMLLSNFLLDIECSDNLSSSTKTNIESIFKRFVEIIYPEILAHKKLQVENVPAEKAYFLFGGWDNILKKFRLWKIETNNLDEKPNYRECKPADWFNNTLIEIIGDFIQDDVLYLKENFNNPKSPYLCLKNAIENQERLTIGGISQVVKIIYNSEKKKATLKIPRIVYNNQEYVFGRKLMTSGHIKFCNGNIDFSTGNGLF